MSSDEEEASHVIVVKGIHRLGWFFLKPVAENYLIHTYPSFSDTM